jgi:hypothetical protein
LIKVLSSGPALLHVAYRERGITPGNFGERLDRQGYGPQATGLVEMVRRLAELPLAYEPGTVSNYSTACAERRNSASASTTHHTRDLRR